MRHDLTLTSVYPPNGDVLNEEGGSVHLLHWNHPFAFEANGEREWQLATGQAGWLGAWLAGSRRRESLCLQSLSH